MSVLKRSATTKAGMITSLASAIALLSTAAVHGQTFLTPPVQSVPVEFVPNLQAIPQGHSPNDPPSHRPGGRHFHPAAGSGSSGQRDVHQRAGKSAGSGDSTVSKRSARHDHAASIYYGPDFASPSPLDAIAC